MAAGQLNALPQRCGLLELPTFSDQFWSDMDTENLDYSKILEKLLEQPGEFEECYAFSIHKAGSSLMHHMIRDVCVGAGIPSLSIPDSLFVEGIFEKDWAADRKVLELIVPGRIYYGFRHLPPVLLDESVNLKAKRSVLLVRDPRDALVSQYYSYGGKHVSHRLPEKNKEDFLERASATAHLSIDDYVLRAARNYLGKLSDYRFNLDFNNVLLRKYEDVYYDKRTFLEEMFQHFGFNLDAILLDDVARRNDVRPEVEDPARHIRKGTPGDYAVKLKPQTVRRLNSLFEEVAGWYGYDLR